MRVWLVGFGTVGRWLAQTLDGQLPQLERRYGIRIVVVGLANAHDGFVFDDGGLDLSSALGLVRSGRSLAELPGVRVWPTATDGMRATDADVLVETTASPGTDGEPGLTHVREALGRRIAVVTSNKWPVALHGVELVEQAAENHVAFRAESTVMSGTPVLSSLIEGLAGTTPIGVRGLLNATNNEIVSRMTTGVSYQDALADAQEAGLAESDPAADVEGHDSVAKLMILSALVFGRQLRREQVACQGITDITRSDIDRAASDGARIKHLASLEFDQPGGRGGVVARVAPEALPHDDLLARIDGTTNALVCRATPIGEATIIGPGAGTQLAGQGVLSDLVGVARARIAVGR